jgi:hypothetical protein
LTIVFFILVNTSYYWEGKLGLIAMITFLALIIIYIGLVLALIRQLYFCFKEKFRDKNRNILLCIMVTVLALTYFKPTGVIDFDRLQGDDILIAEGEGAASCKTILKLKDDFSFRQRTVCFGVSEIKGHYNIINDTIYFKDVNIYGSEDYFFESAVITTDKSENPNLQYLTRYKSKNDNIGDAIYITKNNIYKLKDKKPNSQH